jgi:type I restriction enzyme M protein
VVPNGTLFADGVANRIKKQLVENFNLHTIVRLGDGVFAPYTDIPSNLLFFEHGKPTDEIWYYEIPVPDEKKKYSKTKPIQPEEFIEIKEWWNNRKETEWAWKADIKDIVKENGNGIVSINLDLKNPNRRNEVEYNDPQKIISNILLQENQILNLMKDIKKLIG